MQPVLAALRKGVVIAIALLPWMLASFAFWWLDASGNWTPETPHRGKLSVMLLGGGMVLSLVLWSLLSGRQKD